MAAAAYAYMPVPGQTTSGSSTIKRSTSPLLPPATSTTRRVYGGARKFTPVGGTATGGAGGGGGSSGSSSAASQFSAPAPININTATNPLEQQAFDSFASYNKDLAAGTNDEIVRELQRARDDISKGMQKEGEAAIGRGADPALFKTRLLESGKRDLHALQGQLADVALRRREGALGGMASAANAAASGQRTMHAAAAGQRLAEQRLQLDAADQQQRFNEAPYERLLKMFDTSARYSSLLGDRDVSLLGSGGYF